MIEAALRTDRWFQSAVPRMGSRTSERPRTSSVSPQPVPKSRRRGRGPSRRRRRSSSKRRRGAPSRALVATRSGSTPVSRSMSARTASRSGASRDQGERLLAGVVVGGSRSGVPVPDDALDQPAEGGDGRRHVERLDAVGAREARKVVDVHIGDRGRDHRTVLVVDGVVEEGDVEIAHHPSLRQPSERKKARSSASSGACASRSGRRSSVVRSDSSRRQRAIAA